MKMKNRGFSYKGIQFWLNDNGIPNSPRREFEGKYVVMWWNEAYERWQRLFTADSKKEAIDHARYLCRERMYPY